MRLTFLTSLLLLQSLSGAEKSDIIHLWPGGAPGDAAYHAEEKDTATAKDKKIAGRSVQLLTGISDPIITIRRPAKNNTGAAVVIFPGGGYRILAYDLEGTEVTDWLNSIGVTGILLKYRVPAEPTSARRAAPLQDAQRAVSLVRANAAKWEIDPQRIGVLGFSAGGHLAANLSNASDQRSYAPIDFADQVSCRPDFAILVYPAYLTPNNDLTKIASELTVSDRTPPTFLVQTEDDPVHVENSLVYYSALKQAKVPSEMHIYSAGGHGYGLRETDLPVTHWPQLAAEWLRGRGLLKH